MQLVGSMDSILKAAGVDLCIVNYRSLALGDREGIIEWVEGAVPLSTIIKECSTHEGANPISVFLRRHNPSTSEPSGIDRSASELFIRSCAGYTVISYLLALGDRHLDNLLLHTSGKFFHVDFGYIFGLDPKPFKSPLRFTTEMLAAMGGEDAHDYKEFLRLSSQAYLILRKSAVAILNMIRVMLHADIAGVTEASIMTVWARFRLDISDQEAVEHITRTISESTHAVMPTVMEHMHKLAVSFR